MYREINISFSKNYAAKEFEIKRDAELSKISRLSLVAAIGLMLFSDALQLAGISSVLTLSEASLVGALLLLILSKRRVEVLFKTEWRILVMFAGLFIFTKGLYSAGLISAIYPVLSFISMGNLAILIVSSSMILSQVLSNVPLTALLLPLFKSIIPEGSSSVQYWTLFAASSTLAGALTLLGAASNLIIADVAERNGVKFSYLDFVKKGIPLTIICTLILLAIFYIESGLY